MSYPNLYKRKQEDQKERDKCFQSRNSFQIYEKLQKLLSSHTYYSLFDVLIDSSSLVLTGLQVCYIDNVLRVKL